MLSLVVGAPNEAVNQTRGLMGVYNNDMEDDLTLPNGQILPLSSTEEYIYHNYGSQCN